MKKSVLLALVSVIGIIASAEVPFKIGVAGYTMCKYGMKDALQVLNKVDCHYLCVKDFPHHLPYDSDDAKVAEFKAMCEANGVVPYALGPLYTKDVATTRNLFVFAKKLGLKLVVGVPYEPTDEQDTWSKRVGSRKLLEEIDKLVKEFDIRYAIHNHGPASPNMYPDVAYGWNLVKDLDPRIGFCLDIGWEYGCGHDPVDTIHTYADRIFDVHIKNFEIGKPDGAAIPLPRGKINYVKVFKALADVGYTGVCSLEYEKDFDNNLEAIAESIGYARGICDAIPAKVVMRPVPDGANTLTDAEKAEGWELLFDGVNLPADKFVGQNDDFKCFPKKGWYVKEGALAMRPIKGISETREWFPLPPEDVKLGNGGDIVTIKKYKDFCFKFDFRLTRAANSGVKYFYDETKNNRTCEEYQILENVHPDSDKGVDGNRKSASLYDIFAAHADDIQKPAGEWNSGMIVSKGNHVEHWLNGKKVLEFDRGSAAFRAGVAKSKYADKGTDGQPWGELVEGRILLQDHTDSSVSFCNLKIKEL